VRGDCWKPNSKYRAAQHSSARRSNSACHVCVLPVAECRSYPYAWPLPGATGGLWIDACHASKHWFSISHWFFAISLIPDFSGNGRMRNSETSSPPALSLANRRGSAAGDASLWRSYCGSDEDIQTREQASCFQGNHLGNHPGKAASSRLFFFALTLLRSATNIPKGVLCQAELRDPEEKEALFLQDPS